MSSGQIFPANALAVVEARDVGGALRVASSAVPLLLAFVVGWVVVGWRARQELGARLLVVAGIALTAITLRSKSLLPAVLLHATYNTILLVGFDRPMLVWLAVPGILLLALPRAASRLAS